MPMKRCAWWLAGLLAGAILWPARGAVSSADSPFIIEHIEEGLPQGSVTSIIQTRDGYLWFGTFGGLVRFDGVHLTVFNEAKAPGLRSGRIVKLFEDSRQNLWVGTETAGILIVHTNGQIESLAIVPAGREPKLRSIAEDSQGTVWLYMADGQLCRYQNGKVETLNPPSSYQSLCRVVMAENGQRLWVGMDLGQFSLGIVSEIRTNFVASRLPAASSRLDFLVPSGKGGYWRLADGRVQKWTGEKLERDLAAYPWGTAVVTTACEDQEGNLIVGALDALSSPGAAEGVYWFNATGEVRRISTESGLSHNGILSLCMDRAGNLWVGTAGGGLNLVRPRFFTMPPESKGWVAQSVCENAEGGVWIGFDGGGVTYWKGNFTRDFGSRAQLAQSVTAAGGLANASVRAVFVDREQRVWVGTSGGQPAAGVYRLQNDRFSLVAGPTELQTGVGAITQDRAGNLWFGTQRGLVRWNGSDWKVFAQREGLSAPGVSAITEDAAGNLWIGTLDGGLNLLRDGHCEVIHKSADGLPSDEISALLCDADGALWIGTPGSGLARFLKGKWTRYSTLNGLASDGVNYLIEDGEGYLWIGSYAGLMRVAKSELSKVADGKAAKVECRAYGRADGLVASECTTGSQPAAGRTRDGRLLFPTIKGVAAVQPSLLKPNPGAPPVVIESVLVDSKPQGDGALRHASLPQLVIPPNREQLEIHFTSLNLATPEHARRFRYQLEPHEAGWVDAGDTPLARYPKLPPGEYRFTVSAANEDGVWNQTGATLAIIVQPPFWRKWWFMSASALALLGAIVGTVHLISTAKLRREIRQQKALELDRSRIARDLHDQLGASMTQLSLLAEMVEADRDIPEEVEAHARQITQTARHTTHTLDEIVWAVNPANDTLNGLINYICKNAQDYLNVAGLKYRFDVPPQIPATPLAPEVRHNVFLAAKEAVTNVVRHSQGTAAWIRLKLDTDSFTLEIADDGRGVPDAAKDSERNGLRNMSRRMEDVGGKFAISRAPEGGALITLTAPIAKRTS
ncbi:MAG: hypothetical protein EPO07_05770 [Verrucomicrobia bacterium]|nr:MAG: hypothetical protein EPO07_05770 [Verrucomicrobiota bacterium]